MEQLNKYESEEIQLKKHLNRIGDLINIEGPMLVLFQDERNQDLYLFDWVDGDEATNRWLVYNVSKSNLLRFLQHKISYKNLFESNNKESYFTDIRSDEIPSYSIFKLNNIPESYKPDKVVLFDSTDAKNLDKIFYVLSDRKTTDLNSAIKELNSLSIIYSEIRKSPFEIAHANLSGFINAISFPNNIIKQIMTIKLDSQKDVSKNNRLSKKEAMGLY